MNRMVLSACMAASCANAALAGATFSSIEFLPGGGFLSASAISDDGRVVVGAASSSEGLRAFRWTRETGTQALDVLPDTATARAYGVSGDGRVVAGQSLNTNPAGYRPFSWTESEGVSELPYPSGGFFVAAYAANDDGSMIVGYSDSGLATGERAALWTDGVFEQLVAGAGIRRSFALDISSDGAVIVGSLLTTTGQEQAFRWTRDSGAQTLVGLNGGAEVTATASVSNDGTIIGGSVFDENGRRTAVVWSDDGATVTDLGTLPGFDSSGVWAVDGDGSVLAGQAAAGERGQDPILRAVYWDESRNIFDLNDYLPSLGIDLTGWVLTAVHDISADGTTLIGEGYLNGVRQAWIATIPSPGAAALVAIAGIACARRRR